MTDADKLESMTANFVKDLIKNKFEDKWKYKELAERLAALIATEVAWQEKYDRDQTMMQAWGPLTN